MKIDRTKNATRNITSGFVLKIYQLITPFIIRTLMIYFLGMEYVGLNTLFSSILQVLNLAELGVGSAMVYSMYKPIAEDDSDMICALMRLYKIYYRIIGLIVLIAGIIIMPFVPKLISGTVPDGINSHGNQAAVRLPMIHAPPLQAAVNTALHIKEAFQPFRASAAVIPGCIIFAP